MFDPRRIAHSKPWFVLNSEERDPSCSTGLPYCKCPLAISVDLGKDSRDI